MADGYRYRAEGDQKTSVIASMSDRFRLVANEVEAVEPDHLLPNLPVDGAVRRPAPCLRTSTKAWMTVGSPHSRDLSTALNTAHLWDLAEVTRTEPIMIDPDDRAVPANQSRPRRSSIAFTHPDVACSA